VVLEVDTFAKLEKLEFLNPVEKCEAFTTTVKTLIYPWTFKGKLVAYEYKTVSLQKFVKELN